MGIEPESEGQRILGSGKELLEAGSSCGQHALDSFGLEPWVSLAAACFACVGRQVGSSLAARRPVTAAHEGEAASGEDEDQWTVDTDAGAVGSIDTGDRRHGGVVDRRRHGAQ